MLRWSLPRHRPLPEWCGCGRTTRAGDDQMQAITIGLDIAKNLLQVHGVADHGWVLRKRLGRAQVLTFGADAGR